MYGALQEQKLHVKFSTRFGPTRRTRKAKVPQFVADYIEFKKENNFHVYGAMRVIEDHHDKRVPEWFYEKNIEPSFVHGWTAMR